MTSKPRAAELVQQAAGRPPAASGRRQQRALGRNRGDVSAPAPLNDRTVSVFVPPDPATTISHNGSPPSLSAAAALATASKMAMS